MITIDEKYYIDLDNKAIEKYGIKFDELTSGQKAYISKVINGNQRTSYKKRALSDKMKMSPNKKITKGMLNKKYSGNGKVISRGLVRDTFDSRGAGIVFALESSEQLFAKALPNCEFIVCEHNPDTYEILKDIKTRNPNIKWLIPGDFSEIVKQGIRPKYVWLDCCNCFDMNEESLYMTRNVFKDCDFLAFTFSRRNWRCTGKNGVPEPDQISNKDEDKYWMMDDSDYGYYLLKRLQTIYRNHEYYKRYEYKDGNPMYLIILKRRDLNV
jgi:hypothetical protein